MDGLGHPANDELPFIEHARYRFKPQFFYCIPLYLGEELIRPTYKRFEEGEFVKCDEHRSSFFFKGTPIGEDTLHFFSVPKSMLPATRPVAH